MPLTRIGSQEIFTLSVHNTSAMRVSKAKGKKKKRTRQGVTTRPA
jgi:hypothetical protein